MMQMSKQAPTRQKASDIAGLILPLSIVVTLFIGLVIGVIMMHRELAYYSNLSLTQEVSGITSATPAIAEVVTERDSVETQTVKADGLEMIVF